MVSKTMNAGSTPVAPANFNRRIVFNYIFIEDMVKLHSLVIDQEYYDSIRNRDKDELRRLVDSYALKKGFDTLVYKSYMPRSLGKRFWTIKSPQPFPSFHKNEPGVNIAGFFTNSKEVAKHFKFSSGITGQFFLKLDHPKIFDAKQDFAGNLQFGESGQAFRDAVRSGNYDAVVLKNTKDEADVYVVLDPHKIKSANIITLDDNKKVIPLSQRFDDSSEDFRY